MDKVIDLTKLKRLGFQRKKKVNKYRSLNGFIAVFEWIDENGEPVVIQVDPNNPFMTLTRDGKMITIEFMNSVIADICMSDTEIATEYTRMLEKVYKALKNDN